MFLVCFNHFLIFICNYIFGAEDICLGELVMPLIFVATANSPAPYFLFSILHTDTEDVNGRDY